MAPASVLAAAALEVRSSVLVSRKLAGDEMLFRVQTTFLALSAIFCAGRFYVRVFITKRLSLDDYFMFVAMLIYSAYAAIDINCLVYGGLDSRTGQLTLQTAYVSLRAWYLCEVLYPFTSACIRTSIALMLLRVATVQTTMQLARAVIVANIGLIWLLSAAYFLVLLLQCHPLNHFWEQIMGQPGSCMDGHFAGYASMAYSAFGAVSDLVLGLLPVRILWNVQMNKRTKAAVLLLLSMGIVAGAVMIVRIPLIKSIPLGIEFLHSTINTATWTIIEPSLGIIAGCAATLRPLFKKLDLGFVSRLVRNISTRTNGGSENGGSSRSSSSAAYSTKAGNGGGSGNGHGGALISFVRRFFPSSFRASGPAALAGPGGGPGDNGAHEMPAVPARLLSKMQKVKGEEDSNTIGLAIGTDGESLEAGGRRVNGGVGERHRQHTSEDRGGRSYREAKRSTVPFMVPQDKRPFSGFMRQGWRELQPEGADEDSEGQHVVGRDGGPGLEKAWV